MKNLIITLLVAFSFLFVTEIKAEMHVCEYAVNQIAILLNGSIDKKEFDEEQNRMYLTVFIKKHRDKEDVFWWVKRFVNDYSDIEIICPWTYNPDQKNFYTGLVIGENKDVLSIIFVSGTGRNALLFSYEVEKETNDDTDN